jgi:hypothetical protein
VPVGVGADFTCASVRCLAAPVPPTSHTYTRRTRSIPYRLCVPIPRHHHNDLPNLRTQPAEWYVSQYCSH